MHMEFKNPEARAARNGEFRAIVASLPGETVDERLGVVCSMLGCTQNTASAWHSRGLRRVITPMHLGLLKKAINKRNG